MAIVRPPRRVASGLRALVQVASFAGFGGSKNGGPVLFHKRKERKLEAGQLRQELDQVTDAEGTVNIEGFRHFVEFVTAHKIDLSAFPDIEQKCGSGWRRAESSCPPSARR